jgi:ketosteroid isomerase-like protein
MCRISFWCFCLLLASPGLSADPRVNIADTLNQFHAAASRGDQAAYLGLLTEEFVFLGTDGSERWQGQAFRDFVGAHFSKGKGWTYTLADRQVEISPRGNTAWFDELLDNERMGRCRGSGVLVRSDAGWKIAQYNLSVPVPNSMVVTMAAAIKALDEGGKLALEVEHAKDGGLKSVEIEVEMVPDDEDDE